MKTLAQVVFGMTLVISSFGVFAGTDECYGYTSTTDHFACGDHGNCTWWAAYKRPDLASAGIHGDGGEWFANAQSMGFPVGQEPEIGAIADFDSPGHVAYVTDVDGNGSFSVSEMNWYDEPNDGFEDGVNYATYSPNANGTYNRNGAGSWTLNGFIYPEDYDDTPETLTLRCAFGYCWQPAGYSDRCEFGTHHMAMTDSIVMHPVSKETACTGAWTYCHTLADGSQVSNAPARNYWTWLETLRNNTKSDAPFWNIRDMCDRQEVLAFRMARPQLDGTYAMVLGASTASDLNAYPLLAEFPILNPEPLVYPDIRIWSIGVFDGSRELNEGENHVNPGGTYRVNIYPVSEITDARNGTDDDIQHIETDTFVAYGLTEDDLDWKFLCRSYTRTENLTQDDPHKESCDVTIPEDMGGQRLYVKSKGDATGEVEEDDEGNNWSDEFKEWFPIKGDCNLIISWAGLDEGKTSPMKEGTDFGFKAAVQNIGTTACPGKSRISYWHKLPGGTYKQVADDGVDSDQLMPGDTQWEHTMHEPFTATAIGTHGLKVCADSTGRNEESSETDNCYETQFDVEIYRSDIIVSDFYLKTSSGQTVRNGDSIPEDTVVKPYCVAKNIGNRNARNGIRLKYEVNSGTYRGDDGLDASDLKVGASKTEYMSDGFRLGITGTRTYRCVVDSKGEERELNEGNNSRTMTFTVYPTAPKITITDIYVTYDGRVVRDGGTGKKGKRYHPNVRFKNTGNASMSCGAEAKYYINSNKYRDRDGIGRLGVGRTGHEYVRNDNIKLGIKGWRTYRVVIRSNCGEFPTVQKTIRFRVK